MRAEEIGSAGGGGQSAGEERRAARLIFQVSRCRQEGIGDDVQAGGEGGRECRRALSRDSGVQTATSGVGRAGGRESERLSAGGGGESAGAGRAVSRDSKSRGRDSRRARRGSRVALGSLDMQRSHTSSVRS